MTVEATREDVLFADTDKKAASELINSLNDVPASHEAAAGGPVRKTIEAQLSGDLEAYKAALTDFASHSVAEFDAILSAWEGHWAQIFAALAKGPLMKRGASLQLAGRLNHLSLRGARAIRSNLLPEVPSAASVEAEVTSSVRDDDNSQLLTKMWSAAVAAESSGFLNNVLLDEMNLASSRSAQMVSEVSDSITSVASAVEELSSSAQNINTNIETAHSTTDSAVNMAQSTSEKVSVLSASADEINNAVSLIREIADQTNLLALNATIEAARAGEHGKGFAVVASEVKSLANQTSKATQEITEQISAVRAATSETVVAIEEINGVIFSIKETFSSVAAATEEQGSATKEISRSISYVNDSSNKMKADIETIDGFVDNISSAVRAGTQKNQAASHTANDLYTMMQG